MQQRPIHSWHLNGQRILQSNPLDELGVLASASAGTYTLVPDVLGNGEDWENIRSYIVKAVYQASAIPLLLKMKYDVAKSSNGCTGIDKRVAIMGYSEGGYATVIDMLNDDWEHTYTSMGGAPIKVSILNNSMRHFL